MSESRIFDLEAYWPFYGLIPRTDVVRRAESYPYLIGKFLNGNIGSNDSAEEFLKLGTVDILDWVFSVVGLSRVM